MTTLELSKIKPSSSRVRKTWDQEGIKDLAASIKEQGIISPVKVRKNGSGFELVYGHRRVEAARKAKLNEVPAIIEDELTDVDALLQQITENEAREDVPYKEKAEGYGRALEATGWTMAEFAHACGVAETTIKDATQWLRAYQEGSVVEVGADENRSKGVESTKEIQRVLKDNLAARRLVAKKASGERLTRHQTRRVAEAYRDARDAATRAAILETPANDPAFDSWVPVAARTKRIEEKRETKARQENPREVKEYLEALRTFLAAAQKAVSVAKYGKFSPEAARNVKERHGVIRNALKAVEEAF